MTDRPLQHGPHDYWSPDKRPSPAQWRAIAAAAVELLGCDVPTTRRDASATLVLLSLAAEEDPPVPRREAPAPW